MFRAALWSFPGFSTGGVQWQRVRPPSVNPQALSVAGVPSCASSQQVGTLCNYPQIYPVHNGGVSCFVGCGSCSSQALASAGGCQPSDGLVPVAGVPPLSLFGHCLSQAVTGPRVLGSAQLGYRPCAFCSPCANLQLNCSLCLSKMHFYPSLTCPPPIDLS